MTCRDDCGFRLGVHPNISDGRLPYAVGFLGSFWWILVSAALTSTFAASVVCSLLANYSMRIMIRQRQASPPFETPAPSLTLPGNPLLLSATQSRRSRLRRTHQFWSNAATRAYVGLVICAAAAGLGAAFLDSPFWFPYLALVLPFIAAPVLYRAWIVE